MICSRRIKSNLVAHELGVTEIVLALNPEEVARGEDVDDRYRCDAEVRKDGKCLFIEYDTGSERVAQVQERMEVVGQWPGTVLWVTCDERRKMSVARIASENSVVVSLRECLLKGEELWGLA